MLNFVNGKTEQEIIFSLNQIRPRRVDGFVWVVHEINGNEAAPYWPPLTSVHQYLNQSG
jgi:hypothetical protein